ncbi:D-lactaldehyde dehydrogenase [Crucibulum laeve]|uniref:D-lactaldehyde dehydrogenase n=1 Tax=Crucibulum laeve TaxID=68775 RepID=A0A5C3M224_9AGAR|nr:D-lactaldehyde dehydrogenase [Crucibulum laeve]
MPTIQPGGKVLITGANGYLAMWVVHKHLDRGYAVRGTVRSNEKGIQLAEHFKSYGDRFEIVIVEDITKEGAFDEAVKGVDAIQHIATPTELPTDEPEGYSKPAIDGTIGLLKSAVSAGPSLKRVIYTSSTGTMAKPSSVPIKLNENDWNDAAVATVKEKGKYAPGVVKYIASKVLAEKAAWKFYEDHKKNVNWDFAVLVPPWILGPVLYPLTTPEALNGSIRYWYDYVYSSTEKYKDTLATATTWVDVRDIAEAYVTALEKQDAAGEKIVIAAGRASWQDWIDVSNAVSDSISSLKSALPVGYPGLKGNYIYTYDLSKEKKILQTQFRSMEDTAKDMLIQFSEYGWS